MKVKPSLALRMDKEELIQKGENDIYSFNNGKYTYTVIINREKQDRYHLSTLRVDNGNSNLLEVTAKFRSYTDEINFPWAVLTRTGYNPKFYSDSTLIIDEKLYEKLQMNKVFDLSSYDRTIVNYLYETNDIHHVEINVDSMEEYFYFLVTYSHDLQLIDHQQVGKGDPHHGFWYQSYDIIPQAEASLIVRSSYRLNDKEDILKARDTLMLLHNGTFTKLSLNSNRYGGTFAYQSEGDGPYGTAYLYPNSDNTLLFHLDLNRGAPSYNMGSITGQMHLKTNGTASFIQVEPAYLNCNLKFVFKDDLLMVRTVGQANACGFGFGVSANVDFKKTNTEVPQYFLNGEGDQVWFKKLNMKSSFGKK
ncbi:hypothetical protein [Aquimarina intermedia]|nr:hypothetical protein [Aquimarina intermedia]